MKPYFLISDLDYINKYYDLIFFNVFLLFLIVDQNYDLV